VVGRGKLEVGRFVTYLSGHIPAHLSNRIPLSRGRGHWIIPLGWQVR
jgi:hypothetical protein